jgi:hypothetical protein
LACFLQKQIAVHLNMSEQKDGQLPFATRTVRSRISSELPDQIKTAYASGVGLREIAGTWAFKREPF